MYLKHIIISAALLGLNTRNWNHAWTGISTFWNLLKVSIDGLKYIYQDQTYELDTIILIKKKQIETILLRHIPNWLTLSPPVSF